jgi:glucose/arabinose dehydrogenase
VSIGAGLRGPAGWAATRYAPGPKHLSGLAWGERGRLWLAAAGLGTHGTDGVYTRDPASRRVTKVIGGLNDPIGLLWMHGTLYVASVGRVDAFSDFDGRRFAHRRRVVDGPVRGAENNALVRAPDGRLLMGVSATCDHCTPRRRASGSIVSFWPSGKGLKVYASGIRAPIGLAFVPGTHDLLATMNQRDDLGARTPGDWLSLVNPGSAWAFPRCYGQGGGACHSVPKPLAVLAEHAAAGDVAVTRAGGSTQAFVALWATGSVNRVTLTRTGAGYAARRKPFLRGIEHPMALVAAPDGSLLAGDWATGVVYRIAREHR